MQIERELKFGLSERAAARLWRTIAGAAVSRRRSIVSVYYDTEDLRLRAAGAALRVRRDARRWCQTLKIETRAAAGLAERLEFEHALARDRIELDALTDPVIERQLGFSLADCADRLRPAFATRFVRRSAQIVLASDTRVEASLDRGCIRVGRRREPLLELELELIEGRVAAMLEWALPLVETHSLRLELRSKAERGYRLAAGASDAPVKAAAIAFEAHAGAEQAFVAVFTASLAQAAANLRSAASSDDPEYLHQLRVGLRRLRSALRAFRPLVPKAVAQPLLRELRDLMPALGRARDWDVLEETLERVLPKAAGAQSPLIRLRRGIARQRARARREMQACAGSAAFQAFLLRALLWLEQAPWRDAALSGARRITIRPAGAFAARALRRIARKLRPVDWDDVEARHALRVRLKRLRYACEFFAPCFPDARVRRTLRRLERLQDLLGELNDLVVARQLLAPFNAGANVVAAHRIERRFAARERALRRALGPAWRGLRRAKRFW